MKELELIPADSRPLALERDLWCTGSRLVAGVDEAGRGALAGPVVAAAVILSPRVEKLFGHVRDSKKLTPDEREDLFPLIHDAAIAVGVGVVTADEIDRINILQASLEAMRLAITQLDPQPTICLIDGNQAVPMALPQRTIIKGDDRVFSIGAASIIAKVTRDRLMRTLEVAYPGYGFALHKGYGTLEHRRAIAAHGPSPVHRLTFRSALPLDA